MFFTGKEKKTGSSKVLSEAEIKKKLYGDYETTSAGVQSFSHEVKMTGSAFESQTAIKRDYYSNPAAKSSSFGAASKPEILVSRPSATDHFSDIPPRQSFSDQRKSAGISQPAAARIDWQKSALSVAQAALGFLAGVLWKLGAYLVQALDFILRILDPRKPQARKILYSIAACALVAALFSGVFRLNAQRKKAMMGELRPLVASSVQPASKPASVIGTNVSSATSSEAMSPTSVQEGETPAVVSNAQQSVVSVISEADNAPSAAVAGRYVIQVATYAVLDDASRLTQSFNQAGFSAFFKKQIRNSTGHSFYPVYLGRFETSAQAQKTLAKFRKSSVARPFQDSFIRTLE